MISKKLFCIATVLLTMSPIAQCFADEWVMPVANESTENAQVTRTSDGIDIYSKIPDDDGDARYIHIEITPDKHYIFEYCRNGLSLDQAHEGYYPETRDCDVPIGNPKGYTLEEISSQLKRMRDQAKSQEHSQLLSSTASTIAVFIAMSVVEGIATDGASTVFTLGAFTVAGIRTLITRIAVRQVLKEIMIQGGKVTVSTLIGSVISSRLGTADTHKTNDSAFSSPGEIKYVANEMNSTLTGSFIVFIPDDIHTYESDLAQVLAKVQ